MNKYRCNKCRKIVLRERRDSRWSSIKTYCLETGKDAILRLIKKRRKKA